MLKFQPDRNILTSPEADRVNDCQSIAPLTLSCESLGCIEIK